MSDEGGGRDKEEVDNNLLRQERCHAYCNGVAIVYDSLRIHHSMVQELPYHRKLQGRTEVRSIADKKV